MDNSIVVHGSIGAIAQRENQSLAETFVGADVIVIVDTSGSMATNDSKRGQSRYDVAKDELAILQNNLPGKIAVIAFSTTVMFCPSGVPPFFGDGTNLAAALKFSRVADLPGMRFIVISDGEPDDEQAALYEAKQFQNHIDVIYVGPEAFPRGRDFLARLANVSGGQIITADRAQNLLLAVNQLLLERGS